MLLFTLLACPFTRNKGIELIKNVSHDRVPMEKVKGWMYGVAAFVLMLVAFNIGIDADETNGEMVVAEGGAREKAVEEEAALSDEVEDILVADTGMGEEEEIIKETNADESVLEETMAEEAEAQTADMEVHFIDVGQGDATLVKADGQYMLIDAGDNEKGSAVQLYLQKQGVEKLDYLVLTHTDADHIGGADVIVTKFDIDTVFMGDFEKDNKTYEELMNAFADKGLSYTTPEVGRKYKLGNAAFTIAAPNKTYNDSNNNSIAFVLENGDHTFLFTGDCEEEAEKDILENGLELACDVYKLGHHGSNTSSSKAFLEAVAPTYGVISCAEGNSYGYPHAEPMNYLRAMGVQMFRTDEQGSVVAYSDGKEITWNCAPSETWQVGERTQNSTEEVQMEAPAVEQEVVQEEAADVEVQQNNYVIGNKNTKAFHRPTCTHLPKEKNRVIFNNREEALAAGYYNPCDYCEP